MKIAILGLSITSSWGNGHATTYRGLVRELANRGHEVLFLERDQPWYAESRDLAAPSFCRVGLYSSSTDLKRRFGDDINAADCVVIGSYVPDGVAVGNWVTKVAKGVTAFYDIDTPVTLAKLERGEHEYLEPRLISKFDLYLSFTGGPTLEKLEKKYSAPEAQAFYCSVDPTLYFPEPAEKRWDLGYLGTYSTDRQPGVERLLLKPAKQLTNQRFIVAGPQYPSSIHWPANVERIDHLNPSEHRQFYNSQNFTLNVTRADMIRAGYSPSVRLFEAAACGVPIISDDWAGLDTIFRPGIEILTPKSDKELLEILTDMPASERRQLGESARDRVLTEHTAAHRAIELERLIRGHRGQVSNSTKTAQPVLQHLSPLPI